MKVSRTDLNIQQKNGNNNIFDSTKILFQVVFLLVVSIFANHPFVLYTDMEEGELNEIVELSEWGKQLHAQTDALDVFRRKYHQRLEQRLQKLITESERMVKSLCTCRDLQQGIEQLQLKHKALTEKLSIAENIEELRKEHARQTAVVAEKKEELKVIGETCDLKELKQKLTAEVEAKKQEVQAWAGICELKQLQHEHAGLKRDLHAFYQQIRDHKDSIFTQTFDEWRQSSRLKQLATTATTTHDDVGQKVRPSTSASWFFHNCTIPIHRGAQQECKDPFCLQACSKETADFLDKCCVTYTSSFKMCTFTIVAHGETYIYEFQNATRATQCNVRTQTKRYVVKATSNLLNITLRDTLKELCDPWHDSLREPEFRLLPVLPGREFDLVQQIFLHSSTSDGASLITKHRDVKVVSVQRICHPLLARHYAVHRLSAVDKTELFLFHGTSDKDTELVCRTGPDPMMGKTSTLLQQGFYGASTSLYSQSYAPAKDHYRQMLLVRFCVGRVAPSSLKDYWQTHDSISTVQDGTTIYAIRNRNQVYPVYLITYTSR